MTETHKGWIIINIGHPVSGSSYIVESTFSLTRKGSIKKFIEGLGSPWRFWKEKYNFRAAKCEQTVYVPTE